MARSNSDELSKANSSKNKLYPGCGTRLVSLPHKQGQGFDPLAGIFD